MKTTRMFLPAILGLAVAGVAFAADSSAKAVVRAEVNYAQPEKFTDVGYSYTPSEKERNAILDEIREFIVGRADYYVPEGQKLAITFTEIDLAGEFEPWRGMQAMDIRVVKDIYPPKMDLEFKLTGADGKVLKEGKRQLRDLAFMMKLSLHHQDSLHFDKALLEDWLSSEFPHRKTG